jgi:arginyl-tRNA synthetase
LGHGRWAAIGDALASVLSAAGHTVERESYVNDYGRQMDLFAASIAARYLELYGTPAVIPEDGYHGVYVTDLAEEIKAEYGDQFVSVSDDQRVKEFREIGRERMIAHQRDVLERLGVRFDVWFSETSLHDSEAVAAAIAALKAAGHAYEEDGAVWVRTTDFGDDKDRVIVRADGTPTYLAPDVAYYLDKKRRGFDRIIYLWGADHHGYIGRMRGAIQALGDDPAGTEFMIGQMVNLLRGGEPVRMSKRTGEFVTFDELIDEVGADAARYHFIRFSPEQHMDFDIDLVVRQSQDNPVFYVQYAHARIASILRFAEEQGIAVKPAGTVELESLQAESELDLLRKIAELPEVIEISSRLRSPMRVPRYAEELAAAFHAFYRDCRVVTEDEDLTQARLHLATAAKITLANALALIGVSAPEKM